MSGIKIERMTDGNVEDVSCIERECFSSPWSLASLKNEIANPIAVFYVARIGGETAGYAGMHRVIDEGYITNIAVLPQYRRRGVARSMLENYFHYAKEYDLRMITLEVRESNAGARVFYEKMGFRIEGRRKNFYMKPVENGIIMTRRFKFENFSD